MSRRRFFIRTAPLVFLAFFVPGTSLSLQASAAPAALASAFKVQQAAGLNELQDESGSWRPFQGTPQLFRGLRTGTGRLTLARASDRIVVGSASRLRIYSGETDLQEGHFYLEGSPPAYAVGTHLQLSGPSRARVDLSPLTARLAVLNGSVRVSLGPRTLMVAAGQQLDLRRLTFSAFREDDPWYSARFAGVGEATVQAVRGDVQLTDDQGAGQPAQIGTVLSQGQSLQTRADAWAELGFTGGGYLRLSEKSELKVVAIEKTSRGREVTLLLRRGSAWNVVQKGLGGYHLSTPVVSTAVRGTRFRVDAGGLVKVMEGKVALPSDGASSVSAGEQKAPNQAVAPLQLDELDRFNAAQDAERAKPQHLTFKGPGRYARSIELTVEAQPGTAISAEAQPTTGLQPAAGPPSRPGSGSGSGAVPLPVVADPAGRHFEVSSETLTLPEGRYTVELSATRSGQTQHWSWPLVIDRTPPQLLDARVSFSGRVMRVTGQALDNAPGLTLQVQNGGMHVHRRVEGRFDIVLPAPPHPVTSELSLTDAAGNVAHADLP